MFWPSIDFRRDILMNDVSAKIPGEESIMSPGKPRRIRLGVVGRGLMAAVGVVALLGAGAGIVGAVSTSPQFTVAPAPGSYVPITPTRILDTRNGTGLSGTFSNHVARTLQVTGGSSGVPLNATAITGNLTVTAQTSGGYLYAGPIAMNNPTSSTLNFPVGDDRANAIVVGLTGGGALSITYVGSASVSSTHVILDVTGYFTSALDLAGTAVIDAGDQYVEIDFSSSLPNNTQFILSPHGGPIPAGGYAVCNWGQDNEYVDICPYNAAGAMINQGGANTTITWLAVPAYNP
jgi:hypothetical protein